MKPMIAIFARTARYPTGSIRRTVFVRVTGESLGPLAVIAAHVPDLGRGWRRCGERVRVNRSGTWAVWRCVDRRLP